MSCTDTYFKSLYSTFDFKCLWKRIGFRNVAYFLLMVPVTFYYSLGISFLQLSDLCVAGVIVVWFFRKRNRRHEKLIFKQVRLPVKQFIHFNAWSVFTILVAGYTIGNTSATILMLAKTIKLIGYCFLVVIFIHEMVSRSQGYRFLLLGMILSLILHFPNQLRSTEKASKYQVKMMEQYNRPAANEEFGAKNSNANLAACYLVFLITTVTRKTLVSQMLLVGGLLLMLLYSASRGAWVIFSLGLLLIAVLWITDVTRNKKMNNISRQRHRKWAKYLILIIFTGMIIYGAKSSYIQKNLFQSVYNDPVTNSETYTGGRFNLAKAALYKEIKPLDYVIGKGYYSRFYRKDMWSYGAHNQYIQYIWEIGLFGLFLFLKMFYNIYKIGKRISISRDRHIFIVCTTMILATGFSEIYFYGPVYIMGQLLLLTYALMYYNPELYSSIWKIQRKRESLNAVLLSC